MPERSIATALKNHALSLPEAWEDRPWGEDLVAKVRKKIFAFLAQDDSGSLGVKLPHSAGFALSLPCTTPMAYGMGKHGWMTIRLGDALTPDTDLLRDWIEESYRAVAPKTLAQQLGHHEETR